jgi:class 3 adenylate cyclase
MAEFESGAPMPILESIMNGTRKLPYVTLLDNKIVRLGPREMSTTIPASEWCSVFSRNGLHGLVASFGSTTGNLRGFAQLSQGRSLVGLSHHTEFLKPVEADGRLIRANISDPAMDVRDIRVYDEDGDLVSITRGCVRYVDSAQRQRRSATPTKRVLCTLLFTDIVGSTQHAERLGDLKWHALLEEQRRKIRAEIARCSGTEIDTAGDGFFVRFDSPADALDCAVSAIQKVKLLGIEIRAGVHTGECEVTGRNHAGMAVHMGARIMATAAPGEILVSSTVKDLVMGSGRTFEDRGEHELKGVPGSWRLHALV